MANLKPLERAQIEGLFDMSSGYVMDYTDREFSTFFKDAVNIDIDDKKYRSNGGSKAKRMRAFIEIESDALVGQLLDEMLQDWEYKNDNDQSNKAYIGCKKTVERLTGVKKGNANPEKSLLERDLESLSFDKLPIENAMIPILKDRYEEVCRGLDSKNPLSVILLCGSILEGILLGIAIQKAKEFANTSCAPKNKEGRALPPNKWKLTSLIDAACQIQLLGEDIKRFSFVLRDFRNYIHPYEQMSSGFKPDQDTAKICLQVLNAAIVDLGKRKN